MKRHYTLLLFMMLSLPAMAQLQPGTKLTGSHLGGSMSRTDDTKTSSFRVSPFSGYFVSSNWMLGLQGKYSVSHSEKEARSFPMTGTQGYSSFYSGNTSSSSETRTFGLGPVVRYYKGVGDKFAFFAEASAGYMHTKAKTETEGISYYLPGTIDPATGQPIGGSSVPVSSYYGSTTAKQASLYGHMAPGLVYFPVPKVGIELKSSILNYTYEQEKGYVLDSNFSLAHTTLGAGFYF